MTWTDRDGRLLEMAVSAVQAEHRLTVLELAKEEHGRRLKSLEDAEDARSEAIWKAARAVALALGGALADQWLTGGAFLKTFIGG
jgi:hypothetical protein